LYAPIHLASSDGQLEVVEKLINIGADVNAVNEVSFHLINTKRPSFKKYGSKK